MRSFNLETIAVIAFSLALGGCANLELSTGGMKMRILEPDEVSSCRKLGKTVTSVTASALGIPRAPDAVQNELEIIARNSAHEMGGDTIVPLTVVNQGKQSFNVYKCVNPNG